MAASQIFKIMFVNQGKVYEIYARKVGHGSLFGFIEVEDLVFGERSSVVVDPVEEKIKAKQGHAPFGVEMKIAGDAGDEKPWDGKTFGRLLVKGFAVVENYFRAETPLLEKDNWFDTGDVATIDAHGYMQITDRSKDVIKSGGEWISSIDIENIAVGHPDVLEAAVIGVAHPKWDERPLLIVVGKEGRVPKRDEVLAYMQGRIAKWWMPDDVQIIAEIPHTATGKINKLKLRETFRDYRLPGA